MKARKVNLKPIKGREGKKMEKKDGKKKAPREKEETIGRSSVVFVQYVWCAGTFIGVRALAPVRSCMHLV